jgi:hypothetical protein
LKRTGWLTDRFSTEKEAEMPYNLKASEWHWTTAVKIKKGFGNEASM